VNRDGYGLQISGRDLVGQLIDCSVPIFNGRQITLEELVGRYVWESQRHGHLQECVS
ncbi:hypothetical protein IAF28_19680, partial [Acinetobacter baumannii]|nr:hypothetical protein [Acinetobacter baumannii]